MKWPKIFSALKSGIFLIISLIISDNVAPQHEQMRSWGIGCFCQPWNMTEVSSLHLHSAQVAVLLSASFTCLVKRVSYFFSPLKIGRSSGCFHISDVNTMHNKFWKQHNALACAAVLPCTYRGKQITKKICFRRGLHIPRVGLNLHPNIVLSVKCSGLQRWQTECFVCSLLHMRKSSIMDARWRKTKS